MNTKFVNLTGHEIMLLDENGKEILYLTYDNGRAELDVEYTPQGMRQTRARHYNPIEDKDEYVDVQVPIFYVPVTKIKGLPDPQPNTLYIVPRLIAQAVNRHDVLYVTGKEVTRFCRC